MVHDGSGMDWYLIGSNDVIAEALVDGGAEENDR